MRTNRNARFVPIAILPAILPAVLLPALRHYRAPDFVVGAVIGVCIGLAILAIALMCRHHDRPSARR